MNNKKNTNLYGIFVLLSVFTLLMPVYLNQFGYQNDYRIWEYKHTGFLGLLLGYPESQHLWGIGRPLGALLLNLQLFPISSMRGLAINQFISVSVIACFAVSCFYFFTRYIRIPAFFAAALSLLMVSLPSMTINSFWVANLVPSLIPLFLALFAQILMEQTKPRLWGVSFLLICGFLIYPPATFFFTTLTIVKFMFGSALSKASLSKLLTEVKIMLLYSLGFFVFLKLYKLFLIKTRLLGIDWLYYYRMIRSAFPQYQLTLGTDFHAKFIQLKQLFSFVLSAWLPPLPFIYLAIVGITLISMLGWVLQCNAYLSNISYVKSNTGFLWNNVINLFNHHLKLKAYFFRIIVGFSLFLSLGALTALPMLASSAFYDITYRAIFPVTALLPIILVCFMYHWFSLTTLSLPVKRIGMLLFIVFIACMFGVSWKRVNMAVNRSATEYHRIESVLSKQITNQTQEIRIQRPIILEANSTWLNSDFSLDATSYQIHGIVQAVLTELGYNTKNYRLVFGSYFQPSAAAVMVPRISGMPIYHMMTTKALLGQWFYLGKKESIQLQNNQLILINEQHMVSKARIEKESTLFAIDWNAQATLSSDGRELHWDNGTKWIR